MLISGMKCAKECLQDFHLCRTVECEFKCKECGISPKTASTHFGDSIE